MATASTTWTQETIELAGARIQMQKGGNGPPLLVLHDEMGHSAWLRFHQELAQDPTACECALQQH